MPALIVNFIGSHGHQFVHEASVAIHPEAMDPRCAIYFGNINSRPPFKFIASKSISCPVHDSSKVLGMRSLCAYIRSVIKTAALSCPGDETTLLIISVSKICD